MTGALLSWPEILTAMDLLRGQQDRPGTPWWYRVPHVAVAVITYGVVGIMIYVVTGSLFASLGIGLAAGLLAAFVQGMAQQAHDSRHR